MARKKHVPEPEPESEPEPAETSGPSDEDVAKGGDNDDKASDATDDSSTTSEQAPEYLCFSFGRGSNYCLWGSASTGWWTQSNTTPAITAYNNLNLDQIYNMALTREGDWLVTGRTKQQAPCVAYWDVKTGSIDISEAKVWVKSHEGYQKLFEKLVATDSESVEDLAKARFTVGPHGAWWARLSDGTHHHNLPFNLRRELEDEAKNGVYPEHVALGLNGSYVVIWPTWKSWELTGYTELHERLRDKDERVVFVALSPWRTDNYLLVQENGFVCYNVPSNANDVDAYTNAYMQRRAKADGTTFTFTKWGAYIRYKL